MKLLCPEFTFCRAKSVRDIRLLYHVASRRPHVKRSASAHKLTLDTTPRGAKPIVPEDRAGEEGLVSRDAASGLELLRLRC